MEVHLPSGNTVMLRESLTNGDRKRYQRRLEAMPLVDTPVAIARRDAAGEPLRDADGDLIFERDEHGNIVTEIRQLPPTSETLDLADYSTGMLVVSWSYPGLTIPSEQPDVLDELPLDDIDALHEAAMPLIRRMQPNFKPDPDPASPTEPSSE